MNTATTPGAASAALLSMLRIAAWRTIGAAESGVELARPAQIGAVAPAAREQPLILAPAGMFRRHRAPFIDLFAKHLSF